MLLFPPPQFYCFPSSSSSSASASSFLLFSPLHVFVLPLKTKQGQELDKAFQKILSTGQKPTKLQTDQGTEFLNRVFQKFLSDSNIAFFTVNSGLKASVVERFNRTLKNKMYKYFTAKNTLTYINLLPQLVSSYNNTYHRSIK